MASMPPARWLSRTIRAASSVPCCAAAQPSRAAAGTTAGGRHRSGWWHKDWWIRRPKRCAAVAVIAATAAVGGATGAAAEPTANSSDRTWWEFVFGREAALSRTPTLTAPWEWAELRDEIVARKYVGPGMLGMGLLRGAQLVGPLRKGALADGDCAMSHRATHPRTHGGCPETPAPLTHTHTHPTSHPTSHTER